MIIFFQSILNIQNRPWDLPISRLGRLDLSLSSCCINNFTSTKAIVQDLAYVPSLPLSVSTTTSAVSDFALKCCFDPS